MRILVVEDQARMAELIGRRLAKASFAYDRATTLAEAMEAARQQAYELILLDRRLPDGDGADMVPELRRLRPGIRIMMLSALDAPGDKVAALDAGADDYMTKPFDGSELMARIRAHLRRPGGEPLPTIRIGAATYEPSAHDVSVNGAPLPLNKREIALFEALLRRVNRVVIRTTLIEEVYGATEAVLPGALDTLVSRLRKRLATAEAGVEIHLIRGRGYLLAEQAHCPSSPR